MKNRAPWNHSLASFAAAIGLFTSAASGISQELSQASVRPALLTRPSATDHGPAGSGDFSSRTSSDQITHITLGRSITVETKHRLTKIYITNPEILDSYTANPNQVIITAKKTGSSTLLLWDEAGESKTYLFSADLNVESLRTSMRQILPNDSIEVESREGTITLSGTVGTTAIADSAVKLASVYSKDVANSLLINSGRVKQVKLEVKIVEVDRSKMNSFAFNFFSTGGNNLASTTTGQYPSTITTTSGNGGKTATIANPLNFSIYSSKLNIGATLQDLQSMQLAQILAEPNITAISGQKAAFLAGGEFPFPVVQSSSTGAPTITLMFRPYGVRLDFTPVVNVDNTIDLKVAPEVSALDYTNSVNIAGYTIPAISTRRAETQVVLKSGQTFAISGLLDNRTADQFSKTPGIASVPVLGQLFKSKNINHTESELIVIVTPTLVDPLTEEIPMRLPQSTVPTIDPKAFDKDFPSTSKPRN